MLQYTEEWQAYVTRQARWVDFEHDYKTLDITLHGERALGVQVPVRQGTGLRGLRVLPYCWNDETPLSNHELRMDDEVYQNRQDPAVTVGLRLETGELALIWTTTPWTLPSNLAIAVGPDIDYVVVESDFTGSHRAVRDRRGAARVVRARAGRGRQADWSSRVVQRLTGRDLLGRRYTPPFSYFLGIETRTGWSRPTSSPPRTAPAWCTWRRRSARRTWSVTDADGIDAVLPVDPDGQFTAAGDRLRRACRCSTPTCSSSTTSRRRPAATTAGSVTPGTVLLRQETLRPPLPALLAVQEPADLQGGLELVRLGDRRSGTGWSS